MRRDEFTDFQDYLFARVPELESWLNGFAVARREETIESWFEVLSRLDVEAAQYAVRLLQAGDEQEPRSFSKYPACIAAIVKRIRGECAQEARRRGPRIIDGEEVFECLQCRDDGRVSCWHPESMKAARGGTLGQVVIRGLDCFGRQEEHRAPLFTCALACTCAAGESFRRGKMRVFNPAVDLPLRRKDADGQWRMHFTTDQEEQAALAEFVRSIETRRAEPAAVGAGQKEIPF
jgi:hypothetical protein